MKENDISGMIIGAAIEVHRQLGPGLLESVYQQCLAKELDLQGIQCKCEVPVRAEYKGLEFDVAYRMDMLVEDIVAVELKVAENILRVHESQLLSYLKLSGLKLGLLLNFNEPVLKHGIKRVVNNL
ncbi:GxxExxY protein [Sulfuriflexus sp.]|uniref:GxxExxY protein n=1 Tax=Sulfuriflexus sp. TaxID=2015443 RepID=UPI0028CBEDF5|nr:GxxExxY protein [Sulfuriflexus sp.]MDT8405340.1 GxxExxY protein [Sulfuriflexus sp.]